MDYFAASLLLLAKLAHTERFREMTSALFRPGSLLAVLATLCLLPAAHAAGARRAPRALAQPLQEGVQVRLRSGTRRASCPTASTRARLRYHASRGDRASVEKEIARLQAAHPGWQPPADLFAPPSSVDVRPLWQLYDTGDYAAVRAEIRRLEGEHPDWKVPEKLVELLRENEVRAELQALEQDTGLAAPARDRRRPSRSGDLHADRQPVARRRGAGRARRSRRAVRHLCLDHRALRQSSTTASRPCRRRAAGSEPQQLASLFELEAERDKPAERRAGGWRRCAPS